MARKPKTKDQLQDEKGIVEAEGLVVKALGGLFFLCQLDNGHEVTTTLSGKIRDARKILPGQRVKIELSAYDLTKGRIVWLVQQS